MCVKNVNISTVFCDGDLSTVSGSVQLGRFLDEITALKCESEGSEPGKYKIDGLTIAAMVCCISDSEDKNLDRQYDITWTFEPLHKDVGDNHVRVASGLLDEAKNRVMASPPLICRSFSNQSFRFTLRDFVIDVVNDVYLLKTFLKPKDQDVPWQIQSINSIRVNAPIGDSFPKNE